MEGILDVYEHYFMSLENSKVEFFKRRTHKCLVCSEEPKNGSYGKNDKWTTEKIIIGYLEHLKVFGFASNLANVFIDSVRDSGVLCNKVRGFWEFKEHEIQYVFIIEHSLDDKIEAPKVVSPFLTRRFENIELKDKDFFEKKVKKEDY